MIEFVVLLACKTNQKKSKIFSILYDKVFLIIAIAVIIVIELGFLSLVQVYQTTNYDNISLPTINSYLKIMMGIFIALCLFVYLFNIFSLLIKIIWIICSIGIFLVLI